MSGSKEHKYEQTTREMQLRLARWLGDDPSSEHRKALRAWLVEQKVQGSEASWLISARKKDLGDAIDRFEIPELRKKIGLALSGGGFRASIFHLGVIRRLEELGIMKDVSVISTVSGGSIIGAYYVCQMERRLRERRAAVGAGSDQLDKIRLEVFEEIAMAFFEAVQHNMRTRALVFSPFYHPVLFLKSLWPACSRSDLIQKEYDRWLFHGEPLDQLPSVTLESGGSVPSHFAGPRLVINATSLLTGERKAFSREPISGIKELKKVNRNVLPLSRVVGASAGVPGLFPPTPIAGDMLVDGGVSDNQGIDGLLEEGRDDGQDYDLIIVSDASGQLEQANGVSPKALSVLMRAMSVFQHEIRNKEIDKLLSWKRLGGAEGEGVKTHEFAFVHLFLSLKDRPNVAHRVPSEYIPAIGRIRTDLDQFSMVEREALMYHGYTLVDSQLQAHCRRFMGARHVAGQDAPGMKPPPLFEEAGGEGAAERAAPSERRDRVKTELKAGAQSFYLLRSLIKHGWKAGILIALTLPIPFILFFLFVYRHVNPWVQAVVAGRLASVWNSVVPAPVRGWVRSNVDVSAATATHFVALLAVAFLVAYALGWLTFVLMRRYALVWDKKSYCSHTGVQEYTTHWE